MANPHTALGLMSGTSLDGIDAAILQTDGSVVTAHGPRLEVAYDPALRDDLRALLGGRGDPVAVERALTEAHADVISQLFSENSLTTQDIEIIGFPGQTIRHEPALRRTWQIGDGRLLARLVGVDVVDDFRSADVAAGGEGAPFAPLYHGALAADLELPVAVLNIGGVANVTWVGPDGMLVAFDTGPGNAMIDDWVGRHTGERMDVDGRLAAAAIQMGATPIAAQRTVIALSQLADIKDQLIVFTCRGEMGEEAARHAGFDATVVTTAAAAATTSADTASAAAQILKHDPGLLLFAGGDGTARDVAAIVGDRLPVLGVPSGVKMHSAVFAATARAAGEVARRFLLHADRDSWLHDAEIVDRNDADESLHIYAMVRVPQLSFLVPGAKAVERVSERAKLEGAIRRVANTLADERISLIGPGSTMRALKQHLGFSGTALGVDAVTKGKCSAIDLNEKGILELIGGRDARIVVTIVGGQGYLFGRGNQQLSPEVIRAVGAGNIVVVASLEKLTAIPGQQLLVDTGDEDLDRELSGYLEVVVGNARTVMMPVKVAAIDTGTN